MKKKSILIATLIIFLSINIKAQENNKKERREKIEAAKIGLISTNLNLTTEQAQLFWPIYNQYEEQKKEFKQAQRELRQKDIKTDNEYLKLIEEKFEIRQKELDLDKSYIDKFLKVITPKQLVSLFKSEREFRMMLLHKLNNNKPNGKQFPRSR